MTRFGLIGQFLAQPGKGDALAAILLEAARGLESNPDCELYAIHRSPDEPDSVWVTEVWKSREAHGASLEDPGAKELIQQARPIIAGIGERRELQPLGGKGIGD
ncbi:MAG TPA: putative quinol monooxygenase [Thermoleophilaceae bacterium]